MHRSLISSLTSCATQRIAPAFLLFFLGVILSCTVECDAAVSLEIDLSDQRAYLLDHGYVVLEAPISSGRSGFQTPTGRFKITEKDLDHHSSIYGKIVDERGRTIVVDADVDMPLPPGGKFVPAPMHYFMRFSGPNGLHSGYLPGYPASHGCVRLPRAKAIAFYDRVDLGTPVTVFGRAHHRRMSPEDYSQRYDPFYSWRLSERRGGRPAPFGWW